MTDNMSSNHNFSLANQGDGFTFADESKNISLKNNWTFPAAEHLSESWWNVFDERYFRHSLEWTITLIIAYMLILVIGVIGNCMVILVVILRPRMRSVTNIFIMNLAVADLFVIVFCVCPTLLANLFKRKTINRILSVTE